MGAKYKSQRQHGEALYSIKCNHRHHVFMSWNNCSIFTVQCNTAQSHHGGKRAISTRAFLPSCLVFHSNPARSDGWQYQLDYIVYDFCFYLFLVTFPPTTSGSDLAINCYRCSFRPRSIVSSCFLFPVPVYLQKTKTRLNYSRLHRPTDVRTVDFTPKVIVFLAMVYFDGCQYGLGTWHKTPFG